MYNIDEVSLANKIKGTSGLTVDQAYILLQSSIFDIVIDEKSIDFDDLFFEDRLYFLYLAYQAHQYEDRTINLLSIINHMYREAVTIRDSTIMDIED